MVALQDKNKSDAVATESLGDARETTDKKVVDDENDCDEEKVSADANSATEDETEEEEEDDDDNVNMSPEELSAKSSEYFATGKRHLIVGNLPAAVSSLADACSLMAKLHGETAEQCAEVYFHYGRACLELAQVENNVLENVLDGVPDSASQDGDSAADDSQIEDPDKCSEAEKLEVSEKVAEAIVSNTKLLENSEKADGDKSTQPDKDDSTDDKTQSGDAVVKAKDANGVEDGGESKTAPVSVSGEDEANGEDVDEEDEPSNIQLAWEMLECAKLCLNKRISTLKDKDSTSEHDSFLSSAEDLLSETVHLLGQVSVENENYAQAVEDLTSALEMRQKRLPADSRRIAETHYQMAIAFSYNAQFDEAIASLGVATQILKDRLSRLQDGSATNDEKQQLSADDMSREIGELQKLLPEMQEEVVDKQNMRDEYLKRQQQTATAQLNGDSEKAGDEAVSGADSGGADAASDISHMIKKRKKALLPIVSSSALSADNNGQGRQNGVVSGVGKENENDGSVVARQKSGNSDKVEDIAPAPKKAHLTDDGGSSKATEVSTG